VVAGQEINRLFRNLSHYVIGGMKRRDPLNPTDISQSVADEKIVFFPPDIFKQPIDGLYQTDGSGQESMQPRYFPALRVNIGVGPTFLNHQIFKNILLNDYYVDLMPSVLKCIDLLPV
jgi:hypothetical protein